MVCIVNKAILGLNMVLRAGPMQVYHLLLSDGFRITRCKGANRYRNRGGYTASFFMMIRERWQCL